jgi:Flp pilus assembly pilin Flp
MADDNVQIKWTADFSDVSDALQRVRAAANDSFAAVGTASRQAAAQVQEHTEQIRESGLNIGESLEGMKKQISTAFEAAGIMAAYEAIKEVGDAINEAAERAEQLKQLSEIMGTTTSEMQGLQAVSAQAGVSADLLQRGLMKVTQMMTMARDGSKADAEALQKVGITQADLTNKSYTAANALYTMARSGAQVGDIQYVLGQRAGLLATAFDKLKGGQQAMEAESRKLYGLNTAEISVLERYKAHVATLGIEYDNLKGQVAAYLISASTPMIQGLKQMFAGMGEDVDMTRVLRSAFAELEVVIIRTAQQFAFWKNVITASVQTITIAIVGLGRAIWDALHGRFTAAARDIKVAFQTVRGDIHTAVTGIESDNKAAAAAIAKTWQAAMTGVHGGPREERAQTGGGGTDAGAQAAGRAALQAETAHLRAIKALTADNAAQTKAAMQEASQALKQLTGEATTQYKMELDARIATLDRETTAVKAAAKAQELTPKQELDNLRAILAQKYAAQVDYFNRMKALVAGNQVAVEKANAQEAAAHQQYLKQMQAADLTYQQDVRANAKKIEHEWAQTGNKIGAAWDKMTMGMIQGTLNIREAFRATAAKILQNWISTETQSLAHTLTTEAAKQAATKETAMVKMTTTRQAHAQGMLESGESGLKSILNDAYQAAAGAFKATVGIPYVGPILAPAAAATAFAAVAAFQSGIASAAGGYDVPHDQLAFIHKNEMVLPAQISQGLKGLISGGGGSGVTQNFSGAVNVAALDGDSVRKLLRTPRNRANLVQAFASHYARGGR